MYNDIVKKKEILSISVPQTTILMDILVPIDLSGAKSDQVCLLLDKFVIDMQALGGLVSWGFKRP
jgi:hypothetical protein